MSFLEIYNEQIKDLLTGVKKTLRIIEETGKGVVVTNLTETKINTVNDLNRLLEKGNSRRTVGSTGYNNASSRSHAIIQLTVTLKETTAKLLLVDLAGSEKLIGDNKNLRNKEGSNINKSLLALGNCINLLADKSKKASFVPYRDSKLTRLLKDSLSGNILTTMIVCVSPLAEGYEETVNTLNYASRASAIKKKVAKNYRIAAASERRKEEGYVFKLESEIEQLKELVKQQKEVISSNVNFQQIEAEEQEEGMDANEIEEIEHQIEL